MANSLYGMCWMAQMNIRTTRHRTVQQWIRAITTTGVRRDPQSVISFGAENDAILAQYTKGGKTKRTTISEQDSQTIEEPKTAQRKQVSVISTEPRSPKFKAAKKDIRARAQTAPIEEDFVIDEFVDLSPPELVVSEKTATSDEGAVDKKAKDAGTVQPKKVKPNLEPWAVQKNALREKFPEGWKPRKKLSPDAMEGIRGLHEQDAQRYTTEVLAEQFKTSPEAIRRILRSKWMMKAGPEKLEERRGRWAYRHDRIWDAQAELGLRKKRTKVKDVEDPDKFDQDLARKELLGGRT